MEQTCPFHGCRAVRDKFAGHGELIQVQWASTSLDMCIVRASQFILVGPLRRAGSEGSAKYWYYIQCVRSRGRGLGGSLSTRITGMAGLRRSFSLALARTPNSGSVYIEPGSRSRIGNNSTKLQRSSPVTAVLVRIRPYLCTTLVCFLTNDGWLSLLAPHHTQMTWKFNHQSFKHFHLRQSL